jgi:hypothetical protein
MVGVLVVVGVWVGIDVSVGVCDGMSDGRTTSVGNSTTALFCDWYNTKTAIQMDTVRDAITNRINT